MKISEIIRRPEFSTFIMLISMFIITGYLNPGFFDPRNFYIIITYASIFSLVGIGQMMIMLVGGFDLSVAAIIQLSNISVAIFAVWFGLNIWLAVFVSIVLCTLVGLVQGVFSVSFSPPFPFIAPAFLITIASYFMIPGITLAVTEALPIIGLDPAYRFIGQGKVLGISTPTIIFLIIFLFTAYLLHFSRWGVHMYCVGGNDEAARRAGINVKKLRMFCFAYGALIQSLVGIIFGSQLMQGSCVIGPYYLMPSMVAPFLGGARLGGGAGTVIGTVLGGTVVYIVENILVALGISPFWHQVFIGFIFLTVVTFDFVRRRKSLST